MNILKGSGFLKVISLIVAVMTYFYINNEIKMTEQRNVSDPSYELIKLTAKALKVNVRLETSAPEGYRVIEDKVEVKPPHVTVIGPEALLEKALSAETGIVDIGDSTKTVVRKIPLESVAGIHLTGDPYLVEVIVPIEKIAKTSEPAS
ncbi:MAG: CdaR family protein [Candidatus Omnitrophota bacterium]